MCLPQLFLKGHFCFTGEYVKLSVDSLKLCGSKLRPQIYSGSSPYPFMHHFQRKRYPFCIPSLKKTVPALSDTYMRKKHPLLGRLFKI